MEEKRETVGPTDTRHRLVGTAVTELQTPCFLVDLDKVKKNAKKIRDNCDRIGVKLRVHVKTHKSLPLGDLQTFQERRCICVSTVKEAEYFAEAGYDDIILTIIFTENKIERIKNVAAKVNEFHVIVDSHYGIDLLQRHPLADRKKWSVLLKVDCGCGRAGIEWDDQEAVRLAQKIADSAQTTFKGLYTFDGNSYATKGKVEIEEQCNLTTEKTLYVCQKLEEEGIQCDIVSTGSTPSGSQPSENMKQVTELHLGNYIFYDVQQAVIGSCSKEEVAVKVMTQITGHYPKKGTLLVDCGFTALGIEGLGKLSCGGMAWIEGHPELVFVKMNQETGFVKAKEGSLDYNKYPIGSSLYILPYHSCCTAMQFREYMVHEGDTVVDVWTNCNQQW